MKNKSHKLIRSDAEVYLVGKVIAVLNLLAALVLTGLYLRYILFIPGFSTEQVGELFSYSPALAYLLITLLLTAGNAYCSFRIWKSPQKNTKRLILLSLVPLFATIWPLIFFAFYIISYFVPEFVLFLLSLIIAIFFLFLLWSQFKKLSVLLFLITILVTGYAFFSSFEENYCWRQADQAKDRNIMYYDLTEAEKNFMEPGASITGWFRTRLKCHEAFNFGTALKESFTKTPRFAFPYNTTRGDTNPFEDGPRSWGIDYQVKENDTLESIADKFVVSINTVMWANALTEDTVKPGQILKILPVDGIMHNVSQGETIYAIAKKYQVDAQKIIDFPFNTFTDDKYSLTTGQTIVVPDGIKP